MRHHRTVRTTGPLLVALLSLGLVTVGAPSVTTPAAAGTPGFVDVSGDHLFFGHITWMAEEGISTGYDDGTYRPAQPVTRSAMAAFLFRAAGSPEPVPPDTPTFPDVGLEHPFFDEVEWLASEQITTGYEDGTFRPGAPTSRGAMAAYLFRAAGSPDDVDPDAQDPFVDVPPSHPFYEEVQWLVAEQITTGFSGDRFAPARAVSRQAMAAFIFRSQHLAPEVTVDSTFVTGLSLPWDLAWTPDGHMLYTQRDGTLRMTTSAGGQGPTLVDASDPEMQDLAAGFETGLMGLVLDPDFATNDTFYTCQGRNAHDGGPSNIDDVQVVSWTVDLDAEEVTRGDTLLVMAPWVGQNGRHGGCRLRFGVDDHLWITAGDTACGTYPQDLSARAGKVLRIDPHATDPTAGVPGNPFFGDGDPATDPTVYSYGHRNPQGLALRPATGQMFSVEHGSHVDDEINLLQAGGNYGWDPVPPLTETCPGYQEAGVPMTDLEAFPDAVPAVWTSGPSTIATSGATFLEGDSWGGWEGGLLVAALKGRQAQVHFLTLSGALIETRLVDELSGGDRLRTPQMGNDGELYVTTSEGGGQDEIMRVTATP